MERRCPWPARVALAVCRQGNPAFGPTVHQRFAEWSEARMWVELHLSALMKFPRFEGFSLT
jgi:hypothetical protein